jgi:hypothetical protein
MVRALQVFHVDLAEADTLYSKGYMKPNTLQGVEMAHRELDDMLQLGIRSLHFNPRFSMIFFLGHTHPEAAPGPGRAVLLPHRRHPEAPHHRRVGFRQPAQPLRHNGPTHPRGRPGGHPARSHPAEAEAPHRHPQHQGPPQGSAQHQPPERDLPAHRAPIVRSPLSHQILDDSAEALAKKETNLLIDIRGFGASIQEIDEDTTGCLLDPDHRLRWDVEYEHDYEVRMATTFQSMYPVLWELEGGIGLLESALELSEQADARDSFEERRDPRIREQDWACWCENHELRTRPSVPGRLWNFVDYALRDAAFLGPPEERPSKNLMERYVPNGENWICVNIRTDEVMGPEDVAEFQCLQLAFPMWRKALDERSGPRQKH